MVEFLPEHELPDKARTQDIEPGKVESTASSSSSSSTQRQFPGSGNTLGGGSAPPRGNTPVARAPTASAFPEKDIQTIMGFGVSREAAISALEAGGGNVDVAASFLFS